MLLLLFRCYKCSSYFCFYCSFCCCCSCCINRCYIYCLLLLLLLLLLLTCCFCRYYYFCSAVVASVSVIAFAFFAAFSVIASVVVASVVIFTVIIVVAAVVSRCCCFLITPKMYSFHHYTIHFKKIFSKYNFFRTSGSPTFGALAAKTELPSFGALAGQSSQGFGLAQQQPSPFSGGTAFGSTQSGGYVTQFSCFFTTSHMLLSKHITILRSKTLGRR